MDWGLVPLVVGIVIAGKFGYSQSPSNGRLVWPGGDGPEPGERVAAGKEPPLVVFGYVAIGPDEDRPGSQHRCCA